MGKEHKLEAAQVAMSKECGSGGGNVHELEKFPKLPHAFSFTVVGFLQKQQQN